MALVDDLGASTTIMLDTPPFIYIIEEHPQFLPIVRPMFQALDSGAVFGVTSALTLLETLVIPYRKGNAALAAQYEALLTQSRGLRLDEITRTTCRTAAQLRALYGIKTPDALQLATALLAKCTIFLTNDRSLPSVRGIRIIQLNEYLSHS